MRNSDSFRTGFFDINYQMVDNEKEFIKLIKVEIKMILSEFWNKVANSIKRAGPKKFLLLQVERIKELKAAFNPTHTG